MLSMTRAATLLLLATSIQHAQPLRLAPANPHYYEYGGKPAVLVTSAEHYGAVLNLSFNYIRYLDTLRADGLNLTRIFTGLYRERPEDFGIARNTLAPTPDLFITPFPRSETPGALDGLNKFDLGRWDERYFERLRDFVSQAARRGIIVEVTLFCTYYQDHMWQASPLHPRNNVQAAGEGVPRTEVLTLKHKPLVDIEERFVRKVVTELNGFDNVLYEICNEPYFAGVTLDWQRRIGQVIAETEAALPKRHLIAQNIANNGKKIADPDPNVSVFHFHYARPPHTVGENYVLNKVIGLDETGFDGTADFVYRVQAWDFLIAGGAHYNNLDYSFTAGSEDGSYAYPGTQPGGGSKTLRQQLGALLRFFAGLDFTSMSPKDDLIAGGIPEQASARALAHKAGTQFAVYLHHARVLADHQPRYVVNTRRRSSQLQLRLPAGAWSARWWNPQTGKIDKSEEFSHAGGERTIGSPEYAMDVALELRRTPSQ
jgi:hypothetical protein